MRRAPQQCAALTKAKKRCSITVDSKLLTESGKLAAGPLVRGGRYCLFHTQVFNGLPAQAPLGAKVFYLDFETTGSQGLKNLPPHGMSRFGPPLSVAEACTF